MSRHSNTAGLLAATMLVLAAVGARAQEVFRISWTIQDPTHKLYQAFAERIIQRANDMRTSSDASAATAREDDLLRVTIVGEAMHDGSVRTRLSRIVLGSIPIDTNFTDFLDSATITSLMRRDQYWRDEQTEIFQPTLAATLPWLGNATADAGHPADAAWSLAEAPHRLRLGLDELHVRINDDVHGFVRTGFEEIALPGVSAGRGRIGIGAGGLKAWGEFPLPIGTRDNVLLARAFEGGYGAGLSFEERGLEDVLQGFGGMLSLASGRESTRTVGVADSARYLLGKAALAYGIIGAPEDLFGPVALRLKVGLGYIEADRLPAAGAGDASEPAGSGVGAFKVLARAEMAWLGGNGQLIRSGSLGVFGSSITASFEEHFTPSLSLRFTCAANGIGGTIDPFLPRFSFLLTPVFVVQ